MQLVEQHRIDRHDPCFAAIDTAAFACKHRYNAALYVTRQAFIHQQRVITYEELARNIQTSVRLGAKMNQKTSQWPHGQFAHYLREKAARLRIVVEWIDEAYLTKTCSHCGCQHSSSPRGRRCRCSNCGAGIHRVVTGANNIGSQAVAGA